jgi:hypothetical protein
MTRNVSYPALKNNLVTMRLFAAKSPILLNASKAVDLGECLARLQSIVMSVGSSAGELRLCRVTFSFVYGSKAVSAPESVPHGPCRLRVASTGP